MRIRRAIEREAGTPRATKVQPVKRVSLGMRADGTERKFNEFMTRSSRLVVKVLDRVESRIIR